MGTYLRTLGRFSAPVRLYLISSGLFGFTIFGGIYPLLLNLYLLRMGYGPEFVGIVNAAGMLALALFALPAGAAGQHWGSRRALIASLSLIACGLGLLPLADLLGRAAQPGWIIAAYMLAWIGVALYFVNSNPFLMSLTAAAERQHVFAVQVAVWPVAGFAGSLIGGVLPGQVAALLGATLDQAAPYRYPLILAALLLIPAALAIRAIREPGAARPALGGASAGALPYRLIILLSLITLLQLAGEGATRTFLNVYLDTGLRVPTAWIGTLMGAAQLLAVPAALATPALTRRLGSSNTIIAGSFGMALSLLPLALVPHIGAAGLAYIGMTAMASMRRPAVSVYSMEIVAPAWQTAMSSATAMAVGVSWCLVALGGGYLVTSLGYSRFFLMAAGLTAAGALLFAASFRGLRPGGEAAS